MLAVIKRIVDDNFVFQQNSAPAHRVRNTVSAAAAQNSQLHFY